MTFPKGILVFFTAFARELIPAAVLGIAVWNYSTPALSVLVCLGELALAIALSATCESLPVIVFFNAALVYSLVSGYALLAISDINDPIGVPRFVGETATFYGIFLVYYYFSHRFVMHGPLAKLHTRHDTCRTSSAIDLYCCHPIESVLMIVVPAVIGHFICSLFSWGSMKGLELWLPLAQFHLMIVHSGAETPLFVPDALHHLSHHESTRQAGGELASFNLGTTPHLDIVCGTYVPSARVTG